jgi:hypothetical protein
MNDLTDQEQQPANTPPPTRPPTYSTSKEEQMTLPEVQEKAEERVEDNRSRFRRSWDTFWAFAGPAAIILSLAQYYWPSVTLTTGINLDPHQLFQTQFVIANTGHTSIHDVTFECAVVSNAIMVVHEQANHLEKIDILLPGHLASRGCFQKSLIVNGPLLKVTAAYRWTLLGINGYETDFFSAKQNTAGEIQLVPEAAPVPEPASLLIVKGSGFPE